MSLKRRAAGEGKLGCILWVAALGLFIMICLEAIPVKIKASQLEDYMEEQARFAPRASAEQIKKRVLRRADELGLPVEPKNLSIDKDTGRVRMVCTYTVPLEFPFYTFNWNFRHEVDRPIFLV